MKSLINKCTQCGTYTLATTCSCGAKAESPRPPKYSPDDKYAAYRRKYKEENA